MMSNVDNKHISELLRSGREAKDRIEAKKCFLEAIRMGSMEAMVDFGRILKEELKVLQIVKLAEISVNEKCIELGITLYQMALDMGYKRVKKILKNLKKMIPESHAVSQDHEQAIEYLHQAANMEMPSALIALAELYANGAHPVTHHHEQSIEYFEQAVNMDKPSSLVVLAALYADGLDN